MSVNVGITYDTCFLMHSWDNESGFDWDVWTRGHARSIASMAIGAKGELPSDSESIILHHFIPVEVSEEIAKHISGGDSDKAAKASVARKRIAALLDLPTTTEVKLSSTVQPYMSDTLLGPDSRTDKLILAHALSLLQQRDFRLSMIATLDGGIECELVRMKNPKLASIDPFLRVRPKEALAGCGPNLEELPASEPRSTLQLEIPEGPIEMRCLDLLTPMAKGQRILIISPPNCGSTILIQQISNSIARNNPECRQTILLLDGKPGDADRYSGTCGGHAEVIQCSSNTADRLYQLRFAVEKAKQATKQDRDVVLIIDKLSATSLAGANRKCRCDFQIIETIRNTFLVGRQLKNGGSLTVITVLMDETGSRTDEAILQTVRNDADLILQLNSKLASLRIWPAIDISESATHREEHVVEDWKLPKFHMLRRFLSGLNAGEMMPALLKALNRTRNNTEFLRAFDSRD